MFDVTGTAAIEVEGLRKEYPAAGGALVVLEQVDLSVNDGEAVAIMGPSGSGKSTLLHILGTLERPSAGRVRLAGVNPFGLSERGLADLRNQTLGFIFQDHQLLPQCSALENVLVPTLVRRGRRQNDAQRARELLEAVGLGERLAALPAELSGGERQRVAIARALIHHPRILLCDEPTGNLDQATGALIGETFRELQQRERVALIVVTHNPAFAERFDRVLQLRQGRLDGQSLPASPAP